MNEAVEPMVETKVCSNCKRDVGIPNYDIHVAHCQRHVVICEKCAKPVFRREMESHLATTHAKAACKKCMLQIEAWQIEDHKDICIKRLIPCIYCNEDVSWDGIKEHESYCGSRTELCEHCNNRVLRKDFENHVERCPEELSAMPKFDVCPFCGLHMMPQLKKTHISICIRASRASRLTKEADQQMQRNLWNEQEKNKEVDAQSLVDSMARLTTSESPASNSDTQAKYAPVVPILSGSDSRTERQQHHTGAKNKTAPERLRNNSPETDVNDDNRKNEGILSQLQNLRQPLLADSMSQYLSAEETAPKQILSQEVIGDQRNILGIGRGCQRIPKSKSLATAGCSTVAMAPLPTNDDSMDLELTVDCPICKEKIDVEVIRNHVYICRETQRKRPAKETCPFCFAEVTPRDKDNHINSCKTLLSFQKEDLGLKDEFRDQNSRRKKKGRSKQQEMQNERFPSSKPNNSLWTESKIPCEFCSQLFPFHSVVEHQLRCRPDLVGFKRGEQQGQADEQPDVVHSHQHDYDTIRPNANQARNHGIQASAMRSESPVIANDVGQSGNAEERSKSSPSKSGMSSSYGSPLQRYMGRSSSKIPENINDTSALRTQCFDCPSRSFVSQGCAKQSRSLSSQYHADQSRNPGVEDICEERKTSDDRECTSQQRYNNNNKTQHLTYHGSEDTYNLSREADNTEQNTSIVLYNPTLNQNSGRSDNYQSLHSTFQGRGGKRRGGGYQRNRYERDAAPGEFLSHFPYPGYPDCYNLYNNVPVPPPYPGLVYFAALPDTAFQLQPSYADAVKKDQYESSYYLHDQEKRWKSGSGTYESLSSESDEFNSLEEDESDKSSSYASCQSDFDSNGQAQESRCDQALNSGNETDKEEKSASISTRSPRRNPTKKTRKDRKSGRGGKKK